MTLIEHIQDSLANADVNTSKLTKPILGLPGLTGVKIRHFLNNLLSIDNVNYLEVGMLRGASFVSSLFHNKPVTAIGIENFSEFKLEKPVDGLMANVRNALVNGENHEIWIEDCFSVDLSRFKNKVDIFYYDGSHTAEATAKALTYFAPVLADEFVMVLDDWNEESVRKGFADGMTATGFKAVWFGGRVPVGPDGKPLGGGNMDPEGWWNGIFIAVVTKGEK